MSDDDVPPSPMSPRGSPNNPDGRFIIQCFEVPDEYILPPHNQDARQPSYMDQFPHPFIVDMFYGCAAVLKWKGTGCSDGIWPTSSYYDSHESPYKRNGVSGGDDDTANNTAARVAKTARATAREERSFEAAQPLAEAMYFVASLWLRNGPVYQQQSSSNTEQDRKQEQDRSRDKVSTWLQDQ